MKKCFGRHSLFIIFIALFNLIPIIISAQIGGDFPDPDIPIDGGLSILIAAGVAYGVKKIRDERKKNSNKLS